MHSVGKWWLWLGFFGFILLVLFIDMVVLGGKNPGRVSKRKALLWTLVWICLALIFDGVLWCYLSQTESVAIANQKALEFLTGFVIEKSLSVDNLFVFLMIFTYFAVPLALQRRVLLYGIWGAIVFRLTLILAGTWLVMQLHWVLYLFGLLLLVSGIKIFFSEESEKDFSKDPLTRWLKSRMRITTTSQHHHFFVKEKGLLHVTPLFLVLVLIEISDIIFALDSVPAIFAITQDVFIIFTSNLFAILGLRALYFILADMADRFQLLKYGVALVLVFIGLKMLIEPWVVFGTPLALGVVAVILGTTMMLSHWNNKRS